MCGERREIGLAEILTDMLRVGMIARVCFDGRRPVIRGRDNRAAGLNGAGTESPGARE